MIPLLDRTFVLRKIQILPQVKSWNILKEAEVRYKKFLTPNKPSNPPLQIL